VTIAGACAGKTSTVFEPNLYLYPGSMLVLDPKGELSRTAALRRALGHDVYVLDPFGQSGEESACFNALAELDPDSPAIADDVASITHALIVDEGDGRAKHWNDSARALLKGIILLTLTFPESERTLTTVRELLLLSYRPLVHFTRVKALRAGGQAGEQFFEENQAAVETLLKGMAKAVDKFGGILAGIGNRFLATPPMERGSVFSTASAQTDFLDSLQLREISGRSDFSLASLRGERPDNSLSVPSGRAHAKPLPLAAPGRAVGLHRARANGRLSEEPPADPLYDGRICYARPYGNHGAGSGVFSGIWGEAVGGAAGYGAATALLPAQLGNVPRQRRPRAMLRQRRSGDAGLHRAPS
jgi:hypothetical protein